MTASPPPEAEAAPAALPEPQDLRTDTAWSAFAWLERLSLRTSLMLVLSLTLVAPAALVLVFGQRLIQAQQSTLVTEGVQAIMQVGAASLVDPMWNIDEPALAAAAQRLLNHPMVVGVRVQEQRPGATELAMGSHPDFDALLQGNDVEDVIHQRTDVLYDGQRLGLLQVWFDARYGAASLDENRRQMMTLLAAQLVSSLIVLSAFLSQRVVRPIERLKAQASALVTRDEQPAAIDRRRQDELGQLARHLHEVHARLQQMIDTLRDKNEQLQHMALYDALTGLPNRSLFRELVEVEVARAQREHLRFGLLFLDLDRFKTINDALGHAMGDALLVEMARRLKRTLREVDVVCRQSGDEFMVLARDIGHWEELAQLCERVLATLSEPVQLGNVPARISASIGIALYPDDAADFETLAKHADVAMYQAKSLGRARYSFFHPDLNAQRQASVHLEQELAHALERDEFVLHYQPQIDCKSGQLAGCEALLRWQHPQRGLLAPGAFIALAEESGRIAEIGMWVRNEACAQWARWHALGLSPGVMSINVSALEFRDHRLLDSLRQALADTAVPPDRIELELTESALMADTDITLRIIERIRELGLRLAIDDFGTGYSSLAYLKRLRPNQLKIDRSFVRDIGTDPDDRAIVQGVIGLARALGIAVVAEGVEEADQRDFLSDQGCDLLQGYLIARPMPADDLEVWMRGRLTAA